MDSHINMTDYIDPCTTLLDPPPPHLANKKKEKEEKILSLISQPPALKLLKASYQHKHSQS